MPDAVKVHIHTSAPDAFFVNSFIVEGPRSSILIDTQFVLSEAGKLCDRIAALDKPLAAVFVTHPHPDHYNGLATVLARFPGARVHASAATIQGIKETAEPKRAYWTPIIGADYPQSFAVPDVTAADQQRFTIEGIDLWIHDFGPAECADNTAIALPQIDSVIISDLVYNQVHPWLAEGRSEHWLTALATAKQRFGAAGTLYAGHGQPGDARIIDDQVRYILDMRERVVRAVGGSRELSASAEARLVQEIAAAYPGFPLETIIAMNVRSLAQEVNGH